MSSFILPLQEDLFKTYTSQQRQKAIEDLKEKIRILKFYSNNDFSFKDVHNEELFYQNGKILVEVVQLFEQYRIVYPSMTNSRATLSEEIFCNAVAGEFLVPERALRIMLRTGHFGDTFSADDIRQIADHFSVSREVIIRRLLDLQVIDNVEYDTYVELFRHEIEQEREQQRIARQNGINTGIPRNRFRV